MTARAAAAAASRAEVAVGAVARRGDELLLVCRGSSPGKGRWSVPGGRVEPGETLAQAVVRELAEETGLLGVCGGFVGFAERIGDGRHFVILDFEVTVADESDELAAGGDAADVGWFHVDELGGLPLVDGLAEFFRAHGITSGTG